MTCSRIETDGMRYIDGEMSPQDRAEYERHLENCAECRRSLEGFSGLQTLTGRIKMKDPTDEFWEVYWKSLYRRIERRIAWAVLLLISVIRERVHHHKVDRYKDIER